ncbi:MAG TPA: YdcH family protein [Nitrospinota bacterium]|nr:YdcH family protein [Nitrospinota bacterium]|tara:strand:+ start:84463 stop:84678 length:216 start_codon:yes stop_codon:yes gene_type:complete
MTDDSLDPIIVKLLDENVEFKQAFDEHTSLKEKVDMLEQKKFLTPEEDFELRQLKKQKLSAKDKWEGMVIT